MSTFVVHLSPISVMKQEKGDVYFIGVKSIVSCGQIWSFNVKEMIQQITPRGLLYINISVGDVLYITD